MKAWRKYPAFSGAIALVTFLFLAAGGCLTERILAARKAAGKLRQKQMELGAIAEVAPPPTREGATEIEGDLNRIRRAVEVAEAGIRGDGDLAVRLRSAKAPGTRADAYFDIATFVEKMRELARNAHVEIPSEEAHFGFSAHENEGPDGERIEPVFRQRQVVQYLVETLIEARPKAVLAVRREQPLTKKEQEARDAADASANREPVTSPARDSSGRDYFTLEPKASVRAPGVVGTMAFQVAFVGSTASLRSFLSRLAAFEIPVVVRDVTVEPASAETVVTQNFPDDAAPNASTAPSVVLTVAAPKKSPDLPARKNSNGPVPLVSQQLSKFTVTVEHLERLSPTAQNL